VRFLALLLVGGIASAAPQHEHRRFTPPPASHAARVLFLDRCVGGCTVRGGGIDDATAQMSTLPDTGNHTVSEYAWGDLRWAELLQCVREVYSPYGVTVTDARPNNAAYNTVVVAGSPGELGFAGIGGISLLADDCRPYANVMSFAFANHYTPENVLGLCWAVAHESGHAYGLDHSYHFFFDSASACRDPMSYRTDCTAQKFFRDGMAMCGEEFARPCACGDYQNTHATLLAALGPGTSITAPPTVGNLIVSLRHGNVFVEAAAQRGVHTLELWLNNYRWAIGRPQFSTSAAYKIQIPPGVPNGMIDVFVVAKDDLGASGTSETVTVLKNAPCTSADACALGQRCDAGYCRWDPPVGEFGDSCAYRQYCKSDICSGGTCTQACKLDEANCPSGYACEYTGPNSDGVCVPAESYGDGGCAAAHPSWFVALLAAAWTLRRRRSR
jgi:hypothetical protein